MLFKYLIIILLFFILTILQNSFLPYFNIMGVLPNLLFILFFMLIFFSEYREIGEGMNQYYYGFFISIIGGFFLDIFSSFYFGLSIISLLIVYFLIKTIMYFLRERQDNYLILYFLSMFLISLFIYNILLDLLSGSFYSWLDFSNSTLISFLYNIIFAYCGFYIGKNFIKKNNFNNQLKLF